MDNSAAGHLFVLTRSPLGYEYMSMQFPIKDFRAGQIVIAEGTAGDMIYIVKSGRLEVSKQVKDKKVILGELAEGEIVGEMSIFTPGNIRIATVRALVASELVEFRAQDFKAVLEKSPNIVTAVLRAVIQRLRNTTLNISVRNSDAPFISILAVLGMLLGRRCAQPHDTPCPYCREQSVIQIADAYSTLGAVLDISHEEIDHYLSRAVSMHLIKKGEHTIRIQNPELIGRMITGKADGVEGQEEGGFRQEQIYVTPDALAKEWGVPLLTVMERLSLIEPDAIFVKRDFTEKLKSRIDELRRP